MVLQDFEQYNPYDKKEFNRRHILPVAQLALATSALSLLTIGYASSVVAEQNQPAYDVLSLYEDSEIAIIPYEMGIDDAREMGEAVEEAFNLATDGLISIDVTVIEPSDAAIAEYEKVNADDCIDNANSTTYGSFIADSHMPELAEYDKVVAFNNTTACRSDVAGVAQIKGRYGEVFDTTTTWDALEANGGQEDINRQMMGGVGLLTTYIYSPVKTGVHEILHLYGLGHSGILNDPDIDVFAEPEFNIASKTTETFSYNVTDMIADKTYNEYGGDGIMGSGILMREPELGSIEKYILEWPKRQLEEETSVDALDITRTPLEFTPLEAHDTVGILTLKEPIEIKDGDGTMSLDTVVFVPVMDENDPRTIEGFQPYLVNNNSNFIALSELKNIMGASVSYELTFGSQTIRAELDYDNDQLRLSDISK